jgi:hypothetical protein
MEGGLVDFEAAGAAGWIEVLDFFSASIFASRIPLYSANFIRDI